MAGSGHGQREYAQPGTVAATGPGGASTDPRSAPGEARGTVGAAWNRAVGDREGQPSAGAALSRAVPRSSASAAAVVHASPVQTDSRW